MPISFPTGATTNQIYSYNGQNWIYTGVYWKVYPQFADVQPITGGTFNKNTSTLSLTNSGGVSVSVTGITDVFVTGGTYSNGTTTFTNNTGGTFSVSGFSTAASSTAFTGGTITGATNFTAGLSANTFSATTYQNLPTDITITGATYSNNTFTYRNNTGGTFNVLFNTLTGATINGNLTITGTTQSSIFSGTTISGGTFYGDSSNLQGMSVTNILLTQFFS